MRTLSRIACTVVFAIAAVTAPAAAQRSENFDWNRALAAGRTIEIKGINGDIKAVGTSGGEVRVHAVKSSKKSDVSQVTIQVVESPNGVTICAVYPASTRNNRNRTARPNTCTPGNTNNNNTENNDVEVNWTIDVPRGVILDASTVNGNVDIQKLQSDVDGSTVNGDVTIVTTGLAHASTVNGSLDVAMGRTNWTNELSLSTVNGDLKVAFPADLNAAVHANTVHGDIVTDWPMTVSGRFGMKNLNGTIGSGGRKLTLSTVNGGIEIRKR